MKQTRISVRRSLAAAVAIAASAMVAGQADAQPVLPKVDVTAPKFETRRGGYVISSNFNVDPKMSAVVFPAEPFEKGDIFDFRTVHMNDDEYFVLQECASVDCAMGRVLQVWTRNGALLLTSHDQNRFWIPHEGKMFMFMQRFTGCADAGPIDPTTHLPSHGAGFSGFDSMSPPLVLNPTGAPDQFHCDIKGQQEKGPVKVVATEHDGSQMKLKFQGGSVVFIQRMRAAE